jgi:F-type H+-transporting ATPase subunit epsilon
MKLEIIKPDKKLFEGEAKSLVIPGAEGQVGILSNHAPMIVALKTGTIKITNNNGEVTKIDINGGVAEVLKNNVVILAE